MKTFILNKIKFQAENCCDGVLINPKLPKNFHCTNNEERPAAQRKKWWERSFIEVTITDHDLWPEGVKYDVRCLDGEVRDRPSNWGCFGSMHEALHCVERGPAWRKS